MCALAPVTGPALAAVASWTSAGSSSSCLSGSVLHCCLPLALPAPLPLLCLPHLPSYSNNWCLRAKPAHLNRFHCQNARVRNSPRVARAVLVKLMRSSKASATDWGWPAAADSSGLGNRFVAGGLLAALIGRGHPVPNTPTLLWLHPSIFKAPGSLAGFF